MSAYTFYLGHNNAADLQLSENGTTVNHALITRVVFEMETGRTNIDSTASPTLFTLGQSDRITLKFGSAGLAVGTYSARLITYDATNTNGIAWGDVNFVVR